ncbi:hypothetical protein FGG08_001047 [Glutinoglossum americanum]|uniref:Required for respiratory growth protein 9, mitochondrial n=1 Tax=Glutinoglossum americanum TaxID=1670608 RepID=A0A9P8IC81_9PEZI|nr:hypothetical protein FGG08_001047 [Glutinoglossum americanum]
MPCLACADKILRVFLRDVINLNARYTTSVRISQTPLWRWLSAQQTARQFRQDSTRSPVATSTTPGFDLYVPFDGVLTDKEIVSLPQKARHLKSSARQRPLLPSVSKSRTHELLQTVNLDFEPSILLRQDAKKGGERLAQSLKVSSRDFNTSRPQHIYSQPRPSGSARSSKEPHEERAFVELSPNSIDAIATEAVMGEVMNMVLPEGGDEGGRGVRLRTPKNTSQNGGRVKWGAAMATASDAMGSCIIKRAQYSVEPWQVQKDALEAKFGSSGWNPRKRLSPDALDGIRALNAQFPDKYTTPVLAEQFKVSPEAIRRILKSNWRPSDEDAEKRRERWDKRGEKIWGKLVELGVKPPKKWREMGVGKRKVESLRPRSRGRSERRRPWSASNDGEEVSHEDWDEVTLAERIL